MSKRIQFFQARDFVKTTPEGILDLEASKRQFAMLADATLGSEDAHIMIDLRQTTGEFSTVDLWDLAIVAAEKLSHRRIALVIREDRPDTKSESFMLFAKNRGVCLDLFKDFEQAINWLLLPTDVPVK